MTDKQIIIYKKECYNEPHCSLNQVLEQLNAYKMEADEGKEINAELKAEYEELKKCYKNNSALLDFEETNTTKLVNKVMKLEKTLTEIKEIAETASKRLYATKSNDYTDGYSWLGRIILQEISEVEDG